MDKVIQKFDSWAINGKAEIMENEHAKTVLVFIKNMDFSNSFTFLDVGCGNGWLVKKIAQMKNCKKAVGIDKSKNMIKNALKKKQSEKEFYYQADIESWRAFQKFDYIFSMESLYYSKSIENALQKVYKLLKPNGLFLCGTDFYKENKITAHWKKTMNLQMHYLSKKEWKKLFCDVGFCVKIRQIKDKSSKKKWRRENGTLFLIGRK